MEESQEGSGKEPTKTWRFRRTTMARREFLDEVGDLLQVSKPVPSRRGARQPRGRTRQATETSPTPMSERGRKSSPDASFTSASTETTTETNSEAAGLQTSTMSLEGCEKKVPIENRPLSEGTEDSDEITLKAYAERLKRRKQLEEKRNTGKAEPETTSKANEVKSQVNENETSTEDEEVPLRQTGRPLVAKYLGSAGSSHPIHTNSNVSMLAKRSQETARGVQKSAYKFQDTEDEEGESKEDEAEGEESPEGCESEDTDPDALYCLCRQKHNKRFMICCDRCQEWFHGDCVGISEKRGRLMENNGEDYICPNCSPCASPVPFQIVQTTLPTAGRSSSSESLMLPSPCEDRPSEDDGIKGKIRKASSEGAKKKFKIFQPGVTRAVVEETLPKCIGPVCTKSALPDSVYCGHECILRHAAVAMKSLSVQKPPRPEPQPAANPTPKPLSKPTMLSALKAQMKPLLGRVARKRSSGQQVEVEGHSAAHDGADKEKEAAVLPSTQTEAARAQQVSAIDASVFYKSNKKAAQNTDNNTETDGLGRSKSLLEVMAKRGHTPPANTTTLADFNLLPLKSKPTPQLASVSDSTASRQQGGDVVVKALSLLSKKTHEQSPPSTSPSSPTSASVIASRPQQEPPAPQMPSEQKPKPNNQIRLNIRRSLTDILWKRVNDSDDFTLPESEVGNLAVNIEKALYNMFLATDSKYKNKYRSIMFNLKDPKNKVLFHQVIKGEISPSKLTSLSQDELLARVPASPNISEFTEAHQSIPETGQVKQDLKEESSPSVAPNKTTQLPGVAVCKSEGTPLLSVSSQDSGTKQNQPTKMPSVPDIISSMLKDTTSEHKTHLFDLKCRICTGQILADEDEPGSKRLKKSEPDDKPEASHKLRPPKTSRVTERRTAPTTSRVELPVIESPASPVPEDTQNVREESSDFTPIVIPEVSIVSITRQDPRTAGFRPAAKPSARQAVTPSPSPTPIINEPKQAKPPYPPPPPTVPKSILTKPSGSSGRLYSTLRTPTSMASSQPPPDKDTRQFLQRQETIWKGFLNMQSVAKFVTKGYLVSGSSKHLNEDIPDTIHIGGRILPQTVWEYVERIKTSPSKDLCLIRFQPATDEEEVAYVSLFSYFNSRRRFGVVSNHCVYIKDFYLIPLGAHESVPSLLLPLQGPGFEKNRPNLLLGLAICQKPKTPEALAEEANEKRSKTKIASESSNGGFPTAKTASTSVKPNDWQPYDPEIPISTTPPGSPDSSSSGSVSSPSDLANTVLSIIKAPAAVGSNPISDSAPSVSTNNNPLQTILKTLFGKKGEPSGNTMDSPEQSSSVDIKPTAPTTSKVDLIVQKYGHISKDVSIEESEISKDDDRPYDPEEEYDPEVEYGMLNQTSTIPVMKEEVDNEDDRPYDPEEYDPAMGYGTDNPMSQVKTSEDKTVVRQPTIEDDVAYDPEDSTFFEEMQADMVGISGGSSGPVVLSEQERMLLELNKQIEEQKRQLEKQEEALSWQRAAAGMSMAHFSVSEALLSPPRTSYLSQCDLLQLAEKQSTNTVDLPIINKRRDPRQKREATCVENNLQLDTEQGNKSPLLESKSESILPEKSSLITDKPTSKQGSPVSTENRKIKTEKTKSEMPPPEKVAKILSDDKSCVKVSTKTDTRTKTKSLKTETIRTPDKSDDAPRHSRHRRSHREPHRTSRGDSKELSSRKRQRLGDSHEVRPSQPSSVNVKQTDNDKHHHREHKGQNSSLNKQTSRRKQRWGSPREFGAGSEMEQRGDRFSHHGEQGEPSSVNVKQTDNDKHHHREELEHKGQNSSLNKQTSRRKQRWESPREFETGSEMEQRGDRFSHHGEQGEPSSVNINQTDNDKHHHREELEHKGQNSSLNKQTSRRKQRWESPREFETGSEMEQRGDSFSHHGEQGEPAPQNQFKERGPCQNTRPRGPPSGQFSDYDSQTQHSFDRPFHSNQFDGPHPALHHPGPRGPFGQPPRGAFQNRGPRTPRFGPRGPPFRPFDVSLGPRMPEVDAPWRPNNNSDFGNGRSFNENDQPVPPYMFRENQGDFSYSGAPNEQSEIHRGGDLERGMQRTHFTPPNRFDEQSEHNTLGGMSGPDFCRSGQNEDFQSRQMVKNRRASFPDPLDTSSNTRAPQHRQTFEDLSPPYPLDYQNPRNCPPFSRPRVHPSGPFIEGKGQSSLCMDKPDHQFDAPPRRHSGPLLPTPPGGPTGLFSPTMHHPPSQENPWPPQNSSGRRGAGFEREASGSDNAGIGQDHFEGGYQQNHRESEDPSTYLSNEYIREQSEERRMSDGGLNRERDRRPWPREQGWKRGLSSGRGGDQYKEGDTGESEGEIRRARGGRDRGFDKRDVKRARSNRDHDRDSQSSGQEDRNQSFHEITGGREQMDGRFRGFGRKRIRGRERNRE